MKSYRYELDDVVFYLNVLVDTEVVTKWYNDMDAYSYFDNLHHLYGPAWYRKDDVEVCDYFINGKHYLPSNIEQWEKDAAPLRHELEFSKAMEDIINES